MDRYSTNMEAAAYLARECDAADHPERPSAAELAEDAREIAAWTAARRPRIVTDFDADKLATGEHPF